MGAAKWRDDETFRPLAERLAEDRRWMRRMRRHVWLAHWGESLLEVSLVWGVLGPVGTTVAAPPPVDVPDRAE